MQEINNLDLDEKILLYRKNSNKDLFENIFTECHRLLLQYLISKNLSFDDSEDIIQEYFITSFDYALKEFDAGYSRKFINYIKSMILKRMYSFQVKKNKHKNKIIKIKNHSTIDSVQEKDHVFRIMKNELKDFILKEILKIKNENHRNAVILKLCIPISHRLSFNEISNILGCHESTLSIWVYRGMKTLKNNIDKHDSSMIDNFKDILDILDNLDLCIDRTMLSCIEDKNIKKILLLYIFHKKDYIYIQEKLGFDINIIKEHIVKGIILILKSINNNSCMVFNR